MIPGNISATHFQNWLANPDITGTGATGNAYNALRVAFPDGYDPIRFEIPAQGSDANSFGGERVNNTTARYSTTIGIQPGTQYTVFVYAVSSDTGVRSLMGRSTLTTR